MWTNTLDSNPTVTGQYLVMALCGKFERPRVKLYSVNDSRWYDDNYPDETVIAWMYIPVLPIRSGFCCRKCRAM